MRRREFITFLGGAAALPFTAHAQQPERMRRIGILTGITGEDEQTKAGGDRPALAAKAATSTIPIVFTGSDFPVKVGLVASLSRPGGNVTGASLFTSELEVKKLALLREVVPKAPLIAMLVNPTNPSAETDIEDVQKAAAAVGQQISLLRASSEREIDTAFETIVQQRVNALLVAHDPFLFSRRDQFVALAAR